MNSPLPQSQPPDSVWYGWILKLFHHWKVGERQVTYVWAVLVGMVGSCMSLFFEWMVEVIQWMLTGIWSDSRVGTFSLVEPEWRMFIPVAGGLVAGCILLFLKKRMPGQATEYMEAMSIGNGLIKFRASALKVFSAAWSIASGAAIGKEGPIIQSSALIASTVGQRLHVSIPRLRLLVGCGAAAGFTTAFHAPFSGCLFVSEIIIGTVSMDILAPLLIASCTGFVMLHLLGDPSPCTVPRLKALLSFPSLSGASALGAAAAVAARGWVSLLDAAARYLNGRQSLLPLRLAAAGLVVGILAVFYPEVVGNGQALITGLVHEDYGTREALVLLLVKVSAVAVVFGCGTGGGSHDAHPVRGEHGGFYLQYGSDVSGNGGQPYGGVCDGGYGVLFRRSCPGPPDGSGDGGGVFHERTDDLSLADRCRKRLWHGKTDSRAFHVCRQPGRQSGVRRQSAHGASPCA